MQDMRNCYDGLLSAAAATTNSAYEFSESLRDMGTCLLEKTALNDDDESCSALSMLGNVQFELQKLLDSYRSHVILTITTPSESLLNELRTVEEMKRQCDEKRSLYEYMVAQHREKGKSKSAKLENFTSQELQAARDEYDQEATLCVFRLKSLKQGQCRSLLTQAARHHAAQLKFFRKGLQSLEAIEPHIRVIAEKQHIDYQVSGLDDGEDGEDEGVNLETNDDGELSFDYRINKKGLDAVSTSRNSMEVDQVGLPRPQVSTVENAEAILNKSLGEQIFNRETRISSYSAPIFAEKKFDPAERIREMQQSSARKYHSYVLPTPIDVKSSTSTRTNSSVMQLRPTSQTGDAQSLWHSSPLEPEKHEKGFTDDNSSVPTIAKTHLNLKAGSSNNLSVQLPPSLAQGLSRDAHNAYDAKKFKRQAFSGPLTSKPLSTKPGLSASGPITPTELPQLVSGLLTRVPTPQPSSSSPRVSPSASPPIASSPRISELHELPRPPGGLASKPVSSSTGHSAPLVFRNQELSPTNKSPAGAFSTASRLPTPPLTIPRCFSIPSSNQRATVRPVAKLLGCPELPEKTEEVTSPPLTPMSLSNNKLLSTASEVASHSGQIKGER
ncbi:BAR domain protein [Actinidia chinensis var. chinensis]|uniref:BAR domain protein n=1 Tax=Actinidia chinensis var. chinensis TaxID=1590841 RepID=A0A2R6RJV7_ACTCC|nr:BAR domain protein [Actinidia chinensis var. chinensis]